MNTIPKDITVDKDDPNSDHIASFGYYDGLDYATEKKMKQTTSFGEVRQGTHFIVCCGDVMVKVQPTDYPEIKRRIL